MIERNNSNNIDPNLVIEAYKAGYFLMAKSKEDPNIAWLSPRKRAIFDINNFKISKSLKKVLSKQTFKTTINQSFSQVIGGCANSRSQTWINQPIFDAFIKLRNLGYAHSIEVWFCDELVGGLYGLAIGRAFFGESMFSVKDNASKVALAYLVSILQKKQFILLDCQVLNDHLARLGAFEIEEDEFNKLLNLAVSTLPAITIFD